MTTPLPFLRRALGVALALSLVGVPLVNAATPIGKLTTRSTVLRHDGRDRPADATQPYFAGDVIETDAGGAAALRMDGGVLAVGASSRVRVDTPPERVRVLLQRGWVRVRFAREVPVEIVAGSVGVSPNAASASGVVDAEVAVGPDGAVRVRCAEGAARIQLADGTTTGVAAGETREIGGHVDVAASGALGAATRTWLLRAAGLAALGGAAYGIERAVDDDDDDDDDGPASPVR